MVVIVGGMIRSGSTFSFNVVREVLAQRGSVDFASANSIDRSIYSRSGDRHFILKTHAPDDDVLARIKDRSIKCICTIRRPDDAIASWIRTFASSIDQGIESIRHWLSWYVQVSDKVLTLNFHTVDQERRSAIEKIVEYIGTPCDQIFIDALEKKYEKSEVKRKYDALAPVEDTVDMGFSYYHRQTFFHRRHVSCLDTRSAEEDLSPLQLDQIRSALQEYVGRVYFGE
jgi:hypothetical protein